LIKGFITGIHALGLNVIKQHMNSDKQYIIKGALFWSMSQGLAVTIVFSGHWLVVTVVCFPRKAPGSSDSNPTHAR
jgi:hypothetical protein